MREVTEGATKGAAEGVNWSTLLEIGTVLTKGYGETCAKLPIMRTEHAVLHVTRLGQLPLLLLQARIYVSIPTQNLTVALTLAWP